MSGHGVSVERTEQTAGANLAAVIRQRAGNAHKLLVTHCTRREDEVAGLARREDGVEVITAVVRTELPGSLVGKTGSKS